MSEPNYNMLFQAPNAGQAFQQSFQLGQVQQRSNMARHAMSRLASNPDDQKALSDLAAVDPETAMQFQQQRAEHGKQMLAQHQDNIMRGAEIIRQLQPRDDASWQHAKAVAAQAGVDVSEVPDHFDPQYVQGVVAIADAFHPQPNPQLVPFTQGGGVARMNPQTHQLETLVLPNDGTHETGAPDVPMVADQSSYDAVPPGGQYRTPDGHIRQKQGGATGAAPSGTFR